MRAGANPGDEVFLFFFFRGAKFAGLATSSSDEKRRGQPLVPPRSGVTYSSAVLSATMQLVRHKSFG